MSRNEAETFQLGKSLGEAATGGEVIALIGSLGAGKTLFVKGLAMGLDILPENISSPTYVLAHCHEEGRRPLYHIDLYRLSETTEITSFGLEDYFEEDGVTAVEWADRAMPLLPTGKLIIELRPLEEDQREIYLKGSDPQHRTWLDRVIDSSDLRIKHS